jgi:hypothetical protein
MVDIKIGFAVKHYALPGTKLALQIGSVEEAGVEEGFFVADNQVVRGGAAVAKAKQSSFLHNREDGGYLAGEELAYGGETGAVLVAKGEIREEIFDVGYAAVGESLGSLWAYAFEIEEWSGEIRGHGGCLGP